MHRKELDQHPSNFRKDRTFLRGAKLFKGQYIKKTRGSDMGKKS